MCLEVWLLQVQVCIGDVTPSHLSPIQGDRQGALQALFTGTPSTEAEVMSKMHLSLCWLSFSLWFQAMTVSCSMSSPLASL